MVVVEEKARRLLRLASLRLGGREAELRREERDLREELLNMLLEKDRME